MPIYWGDLHNHCAVSYGRNRPQRALANAMQQLDFCTITGHAFWPDMSTELAPDDQRIGTHWGGFAKLQHYWPELLKLLHDANRQGKFVTLPSYEWHSNTFGDHNVYLNADQPPLTNGHDLPALIAALRQQSIPFMLLPHHLGYAPGCRGGNWNHFDESVSPLVEVYSNHGSCEADDSPYEYHHLMGPRTGEPLVREGLARGHRFGFYASTDTHDGYPGHYGHGRVGTLAQTLSREAIWDALIHRRTIATTGAHLTADVRLDDATIGQVAKGRQNMSLCIAVSGTAPIVTAQLIESDGDRWRLRPLPTPPISPRFEPGRYRLRVELGWGRQPHVWDANLTVHDGRILSTHPYFRFNGLDDHDEPCDRLLAQDDTGVRWTCRSSPNPSGQMGGTHFDAGGTQSLLLELEAHQTTRLALESQHHRLDAGLPELAARSVARHIDAPGLSPAMKLHRAVPEREFTFEYRNTYQPASQGNGWLYVRVGQADGHVAWVSPIWWDG